MDFYRLAFYQNLDKTMFLLYLKYKPLIYFYQGVLGQRLHVNVAPKQTLVWHLGVADIMRTMVSGRRHVIVRIRMAAIIVQC